jgi:hypothetical protein
MGILVPGERERLTSPILRARGSSGGSNVTERAALPAARC